MTDAYVVGVDMIKFGRFPEKTVPQIGSEAALLALDDCGLTIHDMQALYCGNLGQASGMVGQRILQEIGQTGIPVVNVSNACATGATAFREAWTAVKAELYDVVLAVGVEQMGKGLLGGGGGGKGISKEGLLGSGTMPSVFAEAGMEHAREHGTTFEQFAKVSVKNHHHSTMNPKAMYQIETPLETVMNAEMISYPNTKLMCSVNVDGSAAAVIASEKKARELGLMDRAVKVRRLGAHFRPVAGARPGDAGRQHLHPPSSGSRLRDGWRRPGRRRPRGTARLLRHRGDPALRKPRPVQGRRSRPAHRRRRSGLGRPRTGERLRRPPFQGPPPWAPRASPTSTKSPPTCAAKPASAKWTAPASASPT